MVPGFFMLSQSQVKLISSLKVKKYREESGQFIAEGHKLVMDLVNSKFTLAGIYASAGWIVANLPLVREKNIPVFETLPREMDRISALSTPSQVLAVVKTPVQHISPLAEAGEGFWLALDDIRDPGNLGTIIRIADWFGIGTVLCSESCVDTYNPKVVQATMGSIARVQVLLCNLAEVLTTLTGSDIPVYGAVLDGNSVFSENITGNGIILIGNESRGISTELEPFITKRISIPSYGNPISGKAESLNASVATAIICAEFRRKQLKIEN
jgi:TrmH family RNA methyltransferase